MANTIPKLGILVWPSVRALAYASVFETLDVYPNEIIWLNNQFNVLDTLRKEATTYGYNAYFNFDLDLAGFARHAPSQFIYTKSSDVNSTCVHNALLSCQSEYILFTGGGILTQETLDLGKRFIHIHPGIIPHYRGSTCFYYSLLKDFSLGTTAFVMNEKIDAGDVILQQQFRLNYRIGPRQVSFMDYVLDPYIRSVTLRQLVKIFMGNREIPATRVHSDKSAYFVMHPLLRHLTIRSINERFRDDLPIGIFEIDELHDGS